MRRAAALAVLVLAAGCGSFRPKADPSLVQAWTPELGRREPFRAPYYVHFQRGGKDLYFVAAVHSNAAYSPTFLLIRSLFVDHAFDAAVIEGLRADLGPSPADVLATYRRTSDAREYQMGEDALTAMLAADSGVPFIGGEPADEDVLRLLRPAGYGSADLLGFYFLRQIPQLRRDGSLKTRKIEDLYAGVMRTYDDLLASRQELPRTYAQFLEWYRRTAGADFDAGTIDYEALAPLVDGTPIQRIASVVDRARNAFTVEEIARVLRKRDCVIVVYGSSHIASQRPALEAMMGRPVDQGAAPVSAKSEGRSAP
jgi:hypothetical protein